MIYDRLQFISPHCVSVVVVRAAKSDSTVIENFGHDRTSRWSVLEFFGVSVRCVRDVYINKYSHLSACVTLSPVSDNRALRTLKITNPSIKERIAVIMFLRHQSYRLLLACVL